jgi:hypothetical protein
MTSTEQRHQVQLKIDELVEFMNEAGARYYAEHNTYVDAPTYGQKEGQKFTKVGVMRPSGQVGTCTFIDRNTGDVYKPAGMNTRAVGIRYNLLNEESWALLKELWDPHGGWLYLDRIRPNATGAQVLHPDQRALNRQQEEPATRATPISEIDFEDLRRSALEDNS